MVDGTAKENVVNSKLTSCHPPKGLERKITPPLPYFRGNPQLVRLINGEVQFNEYQLANKESEYRLEVSACVDSEAVAHAIPVAGLGATAKSSGA